MMTREICKICYRPNRIGFDVPDEIWKQVIPSHINVVCLDCFTQLADEHLIPWDKEIKFYPVSMYTYLKYNYKID